MIIYIIDVRKIILQMDDITYHLYKKSTMPRRCAREVYKSERSRLDGSCFRVVEVEVRSNVPDDEWSSSKLCLF